MKINNKSVTSNAPRHRPRHAWRPLMAALVLSQCLFLAEADADSLEVVIQTGHLAEIRDLAYSPDGCFLATAGSDNQVILWNEQTGQVVRTFRGGYSPHTSVSFAGGGRILTIGQENGSATQWNVTSGNQVSEYKQERSPSVATDASGQLLVAGGSKGGRETKFTLWSGNSPQHFEWRRFGAKDAPHIEEEHHDKDHQPNAVAIDPSGEYLASAGAEGRTALWDVTRDVPITFIDYNLLRGSTRGGETPHIVAEFSPDSKYLGGAVSNVAFLWPVPRGNEPVLLEGHDNAVTAIAFSTDSRFVATGSSGGRIKVWNVSSGALETEFDGHAGAIQSLAFKPVGGDKVTCRETHTVAGSRLDNMVLASSGADNKARVWSLRNNSVRQVFSPIAQPLNDVKFSPDGRYLAMASSASPHGSVKLWDLNTGFEVTAFSGHEGGVNAVAFSPDLDDRIIATAGADNVTIVWDLDTLTPIKTIGEPRETPRAGNVIAGILGLLILSNEEAAGVIGNSSIGASLYTNKHTTNQGARAVAFSPSARYLATGGQAKITLWDRDNDSLIEERFRKNSPDELTFSADETKLLRSRGAAHALDVASGKNLGQVAGRFGSSKGHVVTVDMHPTRDLFAVAFEKGRVDINQLADGDRWYHHQSDIRSQSVRFNRDGTLLAAGNDAGEIKVFRIDDRMTHIQTIDAHSDSILGLDFNEQGTMLASASIDGTAKIWDTTTWGEVLTFVSIGTEDYVVLAPDNYYASSTNGLTGVAFRRDNKLYSFSQFDLQYNRPDLVFDRLGTVSPELIDGFEGAYRKRLKRRNLENVDFPDLDQLPTARIAGVRERTRSDDKFLSFTVVAEDGPYSLTGINSVNVWVNDVPLYGRSGYSLPDRPQRTSHQVRLELSEGRNRIQVSATNSLGMESTRVTMYANHEPRSPVEPDLYAIAIGVSEYQNPEWNLRYAAKDAEDMLQRLQAQERFSNKHVWAILNQDATREHIMGLKERLRQSKVDDEVIVFVAGHGVIDRNLDYYFGTHDIDFENPAGRGLSDEQLEWLLDGIPARKKLLLMDTCYSGEVDPDAELAEATAAMNENVRAYRRGIEISASNPDEELKDSFRLMQEVFANLGQSSGAVVISAAGGDEYAFEGRNQNPNGVFTYSILEAIDGVPEDSFLRLSQLRQLVVARVREMTGGLQTPTVRRVNLEFDYPFYSVSEPELSDVPQIDSLDFGRLFIQAAEQSVLYEDWD